jgi:cellulose synthase/poly-beta-1,6-N-acetylglucosamine synthase-like glycosyltransferase
LILTAVYIVFVCCAVFLGLVAAYILLITMAAFLYRKPAMADDPLPRIAVFVPAHNEEMQIAETVRVILGSDYPAGHRDVIVISDNSTDDTAARARDAGAVVFERRDPVNPGKGQAMDWLLHSQRELLSTYDIFAVVDADTSVAPDFLREMAVMMRRDGVDVVQGAHGVSNPSVNWRTALTTAGFAMVNHLRPMGRTALGCSTELNGNGMAFRARLLLDRGWTAHSVVEDIEMSLQLLLDGTMVRFNPDAKVWAEMAASRQQAGPQRRRWEGGRFEIMRMFLPRLIGRFFGTGRVRYLDAFMGLLIPPLSLLVLLQLACLFVAAMLFPAWLPAVLACMGITALHVFAALFVVRAPAKVWLYLAAAPAFLLWKLPIYGGLLMRPRQKQWVRTERNAEAQAKK